MIRVLVSVAFGVLLASTAHAATVSDTGGNITCTDKGVTRQLTSQGIDREAVLSPDGHTVAFIRVLKVSTDPLEPDDTALWIGDCRTGQARQLLLPVGNGNPERNLMSVNTPVFSLNGGFVYVLAHAWVTSDAVHQVNLKTGAEKFVVAANSLQVMRTGPYRGRLLVQTHAYRNDPDGGSYDPTYVVSPSGGWKMRVPNTDKGAEIDFTAVWLKKHNWKAW